MYVYIKSEDRLWTVGFYEPSGKWNAESDHTSESSAAMRVHYLNGGRDDAIHAQLADRATQANAVFEARQRALRTFSAGEQFEE